MAFQIVAGLGVDSMFIIAGMEMVTVFDLFIAKCALFWRHILLLFVPLLIPPVILKQVRVVHLNSLIAG
jgi:hypothetical protein